MLDKPKARYTEAERQELIRQHALQQADGMYHHDEFWAEVRAVGPSHPAAGWFEWDREAGWNEANLERARAFARGLRCRFEVINLGRSDIKVEYVEMPFAVASLHDRKRDGGYTLASTDPEYFRNSADVARMELESWLRRNQQGVLVYFGIDPGPIEKTIAALRKAAGE